VKKLVDDGAIGELRLVRAAFSFTADDPADARLLNEPDGGSLMDVGCYCVNASRLIAGEPQQVYGAHVLNAAGVDVRFVGTLHGAGGAVSLFDSGLDVPVREELELVGERGHIVVHDPWHGLEPGIELRRDGETETFPIEAADSYQLELENVGDAIRGRAEQLLGRADAVGQARVLDAMFRSAQERRPIDLGS
jgi:xylose dehydrogenase (NAD/NADP)